jgi:transcriptional regulator with XRE-family HTH domain
MRDEALTTEGRLSVSNNQERDIRKNLRKGASSSRSGTYSASPVRPQRDARRQHERMTSAQVQAANLLGAGVSREKVAETVGVSKATISRWRKSPEFEAQVKRARQTHRDAPTSPRATLQALLTSEDDRVRFQAACKLIDLGDEVTPTVDESDSVVVVRMDDEDWNGAGG